MQVKTALNGDTLTVKLIGELDTPATVEIQPEIDKVLEHCGKKVVIDCTELSYIASSGLRQLITIHKKCNAAGGHLKLTNVNPDTMEIFLVTRFDKVFDIAG